MVILYDNAEVAYTHWIGHQPDENTQSQDPAYRVGLICDCDD